MRKLQVCWAGGGAPEKRDRHGTRGPQGVPKGLTSDQLEAANRFVAQIKAGRLDDFLVGEEIIPAAVLVAFEDGDNRAYADKRLELVEVGFVVHDDETR